MVRSLQAVLGQRFGVAITDTTISVAGRYAMSREFGGTGDKVYTELRTSSKVSRSLPGKDGMASETVAMNDVLESVWNQFSGQLRSFIRTRVPDEETTEDILQEVFIRIHAKMGALRDMGKLESWIYQITRNAIIDHYRRQRPTGELPDTLGVWEDAYEEHLVTRLAADVREMAEALPEPYREAFMLTSYEGLSQKELAERLGLSYSGAKSRVQRARQKIRDMLMICCHFEFDRRGMVIDYHEPHCCCCALAQESS
jgi:RNA polymerase sigma-70 factor (ECF subfamily)